ncbi:hypothetical protein GO730_21350 [Spirosoma sp. HMF3257]|uniref:Uncharacterized protein n=1 Tax=Spirosoma telluris TaxID=2183553 RepID=A0A327NL15_9BACT|nr:hypothetical protein [Spirosoma telluris]RAI76081.1 hypothetical protein HMF3257_21270 [Spirosoma telluris]
MNQLFTQSRYILLALIVVLLLLTSHDLGAQAVTNDSVFTRRTCLCQDIKPVISEGKDNVSDNDVAVIINQIVNQLPFSLATEREKFRKELQVVSSTCATNARALRCSRLTGSNGKQTGLIRYILYNNDFLNRLANNKRLNRPVFWSDYFVLAHEVGHHYFNHTHKDIEGQPVSAGAVHDKKQLLPYIEKEKPNHINEFLADGAAVGVLIRMGASQEDILFSFRQMIRNKIDMAANDTHPSSPSRLAQADRLWNAYTQNKLKFDAQEARNFANDFYDEDARKRFAIMQERAFWTIQPGGEIFAGKSDFRVGQQTVLGEVTPGWGANLQLSRKNWYSLHGADLALGVAKQTFSTYTTVNGANRAVETFKVLWATIQPTYTIHRIGWRGQQGDTAYHDRKGWFVSIGGIMYIPVKALYANNATGEKLGPFNDMKPTANLVVRIGLEKWAMNLPLGRHRNSYQVYLTYSPSNYSSLQHLAQVP